VVAGIVQQEGIVAVRRLDFGIGDRPLRSSACTISREHEGGKRQSVVNEVSRNSACAGASDRARSPPACLAGSK